MTKEIPLTQGKVAVVDAADYERLSAFKWYAHRGRANWYAQRHIAGSRKIQPMHRFILGVSDPKIMVDHVDCDGLNNRRSNLRLCTNRQNQGNSPKRQNGKTSRFKGVYRQYGKWFAGMKGRYLGCFENEEDAARAYDKGAREKYGEFARTNFPEQAR